MTNSIAETLPGPNELAPPVAKKIPKEIVIHGDKRVDDYFWLREKTNAAVTTYLESENAYADAVTKPLQGFQNHLYQEMLGLNKPIKVA